MSKNRYQLTSKAAELYESQKVPAIFRPLAEATLAHVPVHSDDRVLDLACGTGIILRLIAEKNPQIDRIVGVDLNVGMLTVARRVTAGQANRFEWHEADVAKLPFEDQTFSLAFCQQGLQFFPDKLKALREIHRTLKPSGRLALTVWRGISPLFAAIADALGEYVSEEASEQSLAPFSFGDEQVVAEMLQDAGFKSLRISSLTVLRAIGPAEHSIPKEILSNPAGAHVKDKNDKVVQKIVEHVAQSLTPYRTDSGYAVPQTTNLFEVCRQ